MAQITIAEQENAIEPILEAVSGINTVYVDWPDEVQDRELPALLLGPQQATYNEQTRGENEFVVRRQWVALLMVKLSTEGREYQSEQEAKPFLTSVTDALAAKPVVTLLTDARTFRLELQAGTDTGTQAVSYNQKLYIGTVFTFFTVTQTTIKPC